MRYLLVYLLLFNGFSAFSQRLNGKVVDASSQLPIAGVQVITLNASAVTDKQGFFQFANIKASQKIGFRAMGYETYEITLQANLNDTLRIGLKLSKAILLNEVTIKKQRNYKLDSLKLRQEYAKEFSFKGPKIKDMFIQVDPSYRSPHANLNPNSTASIIKFNALSLLGLLGKKKEQSSRLKQALLRDEEANYIDQVFAKEKIEALTPLKGDSLLQFVQKYRPSMLQAKSMTEYETVLYIKKSYAEFVKPIAVKHN